MQIQEQRLASVFVVHLVQFILGIFFFIALLYGFLELILFTGVLLGIGFGADIWCRWSHHHLRCDLQVDKRRVFPDEKLVLRINTTNAKFLPVLLRIALRLDRSLFGPIHENTVFSEEWGLLWYQSSSHQKELSPQRRGLYRVGLEEFMVGDLFGFKAREIRIPASVEIVVYPRLVEVKPLSLPRREFYGIPGARSPIEDPVYVNGTRDYQPGSPARRIHWKTSARHNRLQEKLCEPAEQEKTLILLDACQFAESGREEEFEAIVEKAASYAVLLDQQGHALGFATNGAMAGGGSLIIPISRSPVQLPMILEALARVKTKTEGPLMDIFLHHYNLPWAVSCLAFTYEKDEATAVIKAYMRNRNIPIVFVHARKSPGFHYDQYPSVTRNSGMDEIVPGEEKDL